VSLFYDYNYIILIFITFSLILAVNLLVISGLYSVSPSNIIVITNWWSSFVTLSTSVPTVFKASFKLETFESVTLFGNKSIVSFLNSSFL